MSDISVIAADKIGKGLTINPITGLLDVQLSSDSGNITEFGTDNGLKTINGANGVEGIAWENVELTSAFYPYFPSNNPVTPTNMQIGKDVHGNIWLKGAFINISGASQPANTYFGEISSNMFLAGYTEATGLYQLANVPVNIASAPSTTVMYLRMQFYQNRQRFALSGAMAANMCVTIPQQIIGFAAY